MPESTHQLFAYFTMLLRELRKAVQKGFVMYKERATRMHRLIVLS